MTAPFVPFYPSDWLAGTRALSAEETGVYITLIAMMYETEAPIDMPDDRLARLCGCGTKAFVKAKESLIECGKISIVNGGLWQDRVEKEVKKRSARTESAKSSASHRWGKTVKKQRNDDANAMRTQCDDDANHNHNTTPSGVVARAGATATPLSDRNPDTRVRLLAAMGVGPDGVSGPTSFIGGMGDMAEADKWSGLGLSLDDQCRLIAERVAAVQRKQPGWRPRAFSYFSPAMAEFVARRSSPVTVPPVQTTETNEADKRRAFLRKVAGSEK